eukprot:g65587.t1
MSLFGDDAFHHYHSSIDTLNLRGPPSSEGVQQNVFLRVLAASVTSSVAVFNSKETLAEISALNKAMNNCLCNSSRPIPATGASPSYRVTPPPLHLALFSYCSAPWLTLDKKFQKEIGQTSAPSTWDLQDRWQLQRNVGLTLVTSFLSKLFITTTQPQLQPLDWWDLYRLPSLRAQPLAPTPAPVSSSTSSTNSSSSGSSPASSSAPTSTVLGLRRLRTFHRFRDVVLLTVYDFKRESNYFLPLFRVDIGLLRNWLRPSEAKQHQP